MKRMAAWRMRAAVVGGMLGASLAGEYAFAWEGVLGTSMDLRVTARGPAEAGAARDAAMAEVERLEGILSAYEPSAELARVNAGAGWVKVSAELREVLGLYEAWGKRTEGVISAGTWEMDGEMVRRTGTARINVDALGKAYIIERVAAKLRGVEGISGALVDIGGDIRAWGRDGEGRIWRVGVADPMDPVDNGPGLGVIGLDEMGVASSGGYARGRHILDGRTGLAAEGIAGTTVVARDLVTANALATTLNVLPAKEGVALAKRFGAECVVVGNDGGITGSMAGMGRPAVRREAEEKGKAWPAGYQVVVGIDLPPSTGRKPKRPYMCLWIEDGNGNHVRTVEVWGKEVKYLKEMKTWWRHGSRDPEMVKAVTRATRVPGKYLLAWDGRDQKGNAVPPGTYTVWMEVASEKGAHSAGGGKIVCGEQKAVGKIEKTAAYNEAALVYGPKETAK